MKWINLILSVIILFLSVVPCCSDEPDLSETSSNKALSAQIIPTKDQHLDHKCCSHFSPFDLCCNNLGFVFPKNLDIEIQSEIYLIKTSNFEYSSPNISSYFQNIWQPPKIS